MVSHLIGSQAPDQVLRRPVRKWNQKPSARDPCPADPCLHPRDPCPDLSIAEATLTKRTTWVLLGPCLMTRRSANLLASEATAGIEPAMKVLQTAAPFPSQEAKIHKNFERRVL